MIGAIFTHQMNAIPFYKAMLGPLLLAQGRQLRRTALLLPEALGERDGLVGAEHPSAPLTLLFLGDSTMAGVGVEHQSGALAHQVSVLVGERLCRPVRWQLLARTGLTTSQTLAFAMNHELLSADVVVTSLGTNDVTSQRGPSQFIADYKELVAATMRRSGARNVVLSGIPPLHRTPAVPQPLRWYLGTYAHLLDCHLQQWVGGEPHLSYVSLQWASDRAEMAADGFHPGAHQYRRWAQFLTESIVESLVPAPCSATILDP